MYSNIEKKFREFLDSNIDGEHNLDLDDITGWINSNLDPDDVFDESILERWADENGFIVNDDYELDDEI